MTSQPVDARDVDTTPTSVEASRCPWHAYQELRDRGSVLHTAFPPGFPAYAVTHFDDVVEVLQDPRLSKQFPEDEDARKMGYVFSQQATHLLNTDAPEHTRLRRLIAPAFTPRRIAALAPRVQEIVDGLLDAAATRDVTDAIAELAYPLSITMICEILGVPAEDRSDFRDWSIAATTSGAGKGGPNAGAQALVGYLTGLIERRRRELIGVQNADDAPDVLARMILTRDAEDGSLSDSELIGNAFLLLIAGHETTVGLIGAILLGLARHRDQRQLLLDDPGLVEGAVEEFLRIDGPVQRTTFRIATEDVTVGDAVIPKGGQVLAYLGAANHDPAVFDRPDELDVTRPIDRHVAFGQGIHFCVGAPLARLEAQIVLRSVLARFPEYELAVPDEELTYLPTVVRALSALPLRFQA